jgi:hypothetical protein
MAWIPGLDRYAFLTAVAVLIAACSGSGSALHPQPVSPADTAARMTAAGTLPPTNPQATPTASLPPAQLVDNHLLRIELPAR